MLVVAIILIALFMLADQRFGFGLPGPRDEAVAVAVDAALGATFEPLDRDTATSLGLPGGDKGLVVTSLGEAGPAAQAGIRPGDVIERIGGMPVASLGDAAAALRAAHRPIVLTLNRHGRYARVQLPIAGLPDLRGPAKQGAER